MNDIKDILNEIYPRLDRSQLLAEFNPEKSGSYYLLNCPNCNKREAYIYDNKTHINCNRLNNCSYSKSIWDYVQERNGFTNRETLVELARLSGVNLPENNYSDEKYSEARETSNVLEKSLNYMKSLLWQEQGKPALDYLLKRGYTTDEIKVMELGFYPSLKSLEEYLLNNGSIYNAINNSGLKTKGFGTTHQLVIPYRDSVGMLKGFIVRSLLSNEELEEINEKKYKYSYGIEKDTLFNLYQTRHLREITIVEGYLDCLIANARGLKGIVGTGGSTITKIQLENAVKLGFKSFTLALDNDQAGQLGTEKAIRMIYREGLKAFVMTLPDKFKDPDEFIISNGAEALSKLIKQSESGTKWLAKYLPIKHNNLETDKDKDAAIEEALSYGESIRDPLIAHDYLKTATEILDIPPEFLELKFESYKEKIHRQKLERDYKDLFRDASKLIEEDQIESIESFITEKIQNIKAGTVSKVIKPYTLNDLENDLATTVEGLKTGYKKLDELLLIPQQAITIIAGRPSHGKTTLLLNLYLNMIELYPKKTFLFFSYEETKKQLSLKILNILSDHMVNQKQNLQQIENYVKFKNKDVYQIEKGKLKLKELTESSRLWLIDEPFYVHQLVNQISYLKDRYDIGAVFIDYIQKIKINGRFSTRQIELQKISETILEAAKTLSLPIILGAQLGRDKDSKNKIRLDNLREAGDIENDANLVIAVNNEAMEKALTQNEKLTDRIVNL
ncbi:MAG: toprim domain-containing protein, partial [Candidatus Sericytochromatia bacterium]|nr:toprim domain-containing protein [Candidatus Sericytochromatia bacterium]